MQATQPAPLNQLAERAIIERAWGFNLRILDFGDLTKGGSAVAIRVGSRYMAATAAHVVKGRSKLAIVSKGGLESYIDEFLAVHHDERCDVAIIEVAPDCARRLHTAFANASEDVCIVPSAVETYAWIVGCPGDYIHRHPPRRLSQDSVLQQLDVASLTIPTWTIPHREWPKRPIHPPLYPRVDILLDGVIEGPMSPLLPSNSGRAWESIDVGPPRPAGLSGGGVWTHSGKSVKRIWHPRPQLIGIQTGVLPESQLFRAVSIGRWMDLVERSYPDAKAVVDRIRSRRWSDHTSVPVDGGT